VLAPQCQKPCPNTKSHTPDIIWDPCTDVWSFHELMQPQEWLPLPSLLGLNWVCVASSPVESQQPPLHRRARYLNRLKLGITPQKAVFQWSTLMPDSAPRSLRYLAKTQGLQMGSTRGADISAGVKGLGSCITWYALHLQNRSISR
jgi:hypothetical protein